MTENENLESKYGRRKSSDEQTNKNPESSANRPAAKNEIKTKYGRENEQQEKQKQTQTQEDKEKSIKANIEDVLTKYSNEHKSLSQPIGSKIQKTASQETTFVKILKAFIIFLILLVTSCIIIAFIMKPKINIEGEQIIEQIKKAETLYYTKVRKYHYFTKTNYDNTLGIDLSNYKFFTSYEVIPSEESGNYEAKLYGATNAFTITYYAVKSFFNK